MEILDLEEKKWSKNELHNNHAEKCLFELTYWISEEANRRALIRDFQLGLERWREWKLSDC